jgi:hypothetical protein
MLPDLHTSAVQIIHHSWAFKKSTSSSLSGKPQDLFETTSLKMREVKFRSQHNTQKNAARAGVLINNTLVLTPSDVSGGHQDVVSATTSTMVSISPSLQA